MKINLENQLIQVSSQMKGISTAFIQSNLFCTASITTQKR